MASKDMNLLMTPLCFIYGTPTYFVLELMKEMFDKQMSTLLTEVSHIAHFWVSYGRCTMPGSPMGWSEGFSRCWAG